MDAVRTSWRESSGVLVDVLVDFFEGAGGGGGRQ